MRGSLSALVAVGVVGWLVVACGSENGGKFKCTNSAIANGNTTRCEGNGQFDEAPQQYDCAPLGAGGGDLATKTLAPLAGDLGMPQGICPDGTGIVSFIKDPRTPGLGGASSSGSSGASSGDLSSSSSGGSSSGGSSSGDSVPGTSSSGGSSSGDSAPGTSSSSSSGAPNPDAGTGNPPSNGSCESGYKCTSHGKSASCACTRCDQGHHYVDGECVPKDNKGNNGVGNGEDPEPPGTPPINDGPGTGPGNPGLRGGAQ